MDTAILIDDSGAVALVPERDVPNTELASRPLTVDEITDGITELIREVARQLDPEEMPHWIGKLQGAMAEGLKEVVGAE